MSTVEPTISGFVWSAEWPSWLTWTGEQKDWQVSLGDHSGGIIPTASEEDAQAITVSAGPHAGPRWFIVEDPRGLAAALIAAADAAERPCWRCDNVGDDGEKCDRHKPAEVQS